MKRSYEIHPIQETIKYAIQIYIEEFGRVTPTEVLRFAQFEENKAMRSLVIELAKGMEYTVKSSGKGYVIVDTPIDNDIEREYEVQYAVRSEGNVVTLYFDCVANSRQEAESVFWDYRLTKCGEDAYKDVFIECISVNLWD